MTWTQGEDELLAAGLLRYGQDWIRISEHIMPVKTVTEMRDRQKNRCHRVEGNCIRVRPFVKALLPLLHFQPAAKDHFFVKATQCLLLYSGCMYRRVRCSL